LTSRTVEFLIRDLSAYPGVEGCALVDAGSGMVWFHGGAMPGIVQLAEAAIEFWRVQGRLAGHFSEFGPLQSAAYAFRDKVVALFPCAERPPLVLVCVARKDVSWPEWGRQVAVVKKVLAEATVATSP
jgi:hypothetical protein